MKLNTYKNYLLVALAVVFSGCDKVLDIEPENALSGNIYTSDENFEAAINGAYVNLGGIYDGIDGGELYGGDFQLMGTLLARQKNITFFWRASEAPNYQDFMDKDILAINARVEANWRRAYETINIVNGVLANTDAIENATLRSRIEGEALAIRGILYFELVRFWGPQWDPAGPASNTAPAVPILLEQITDAGNIPQLTRASVADVYARVIEDLTEAVALVGNNEGRIDEDVCRAFLARVYMQQLDWPKALLELNQVIPGYALNSNYMDAFNNTAPSTEDVFAIQQNTVSSTGNIGTRTGLVAHLASLKGVGFAAMNINYGLMNTYNVFSNTPNFYSPDARYVLQDNLNTNSSISEVNANTAFYNDVINTTQVTSAKFYRTDAVIPVIRLSELLLSRAEATLENGGLASPVTGSALADLNAVRTRSGLPQLLDTLTAGEFYDSLIIERSREHLFEGLFFHDLKRWAAANRPNVNIVGDQLFSPLDDDLILPIPQAECDASPGLCN